LNPRLPQENDIEMGDPKNPSSTGFKDVLIGLLVVVVLLGFLALAAVRTADLYYKAGWIVTHFPPKGAVCTEAFCLRTDTSKPEGKFLEWHLAYCPDHLPSGFQGRGGRPVGVLIYLTIFMTAIALLSIPILGALFRIAAAPVLIAMRRPWKELVPFSGTEGPGDKVQTAGMIAGALVALVAIVLFCWY
jgi:hypothetical protein